MNRMSEWEDLYSMPMGTQKWIGSMVEVIRVPGGVLYKCMEDRLQSNTIYHQTGQSTNTEENISVSITFASFPPGLVEKLSQL